MSARIDLILHNNNDNDDATYHKHFKKPSEQ